MTPEQTRKHIEYKISIGELNASMGGKMLVSHIRNPDASYMDLFKEARLDPIPSIVYHASPRSNRESILQRGILASLPSKSGRWNKYHGVNAQIKGVYTSAQPDVEGVWITHGKWDIWAIIVTGLNWTHDPINDGSWVITEDIGPERIAHLGAFPFRSVQTSGRDRTAEAMTKFTGQWFVRPLRRMRYNRRPHFFVEGKAMSLCGKSHRNDGDLRFDPDSMHTTDIDPGLGRPQFRSTLCGTCEFLSVVTLPSVHLGRP